MMVVIDICVTIKNFFDNKNMNLIFYFISKTMHSLFWSVSKKMSFLFIH